MNVIAIRLVSVGVLTSFVAMCKILMVVVAFLNVCVNSIFLGHAIHYHLPL